MTRRKKKGMPPLRDSVTETSSDVQLTRVQSVKAWSTVLRVVPAAMASRSALSEVSVMGTGPHHAGQPKRRQRKARAGAGAARASDMAGVRASCKGCHDELRVKYRGELRASALPWHGK